MDQQTRDRNAYKQASTRLCDGKETSEDGWLIEEAHAAIVQGIGGEAIAKSLRKKGAIPRGSFIAVERGADIIWRDVMRSASQALAAGQNAGPLFDSARRKIAMMLKETPSRTALDKMLADLDASSELRAHLLGEPEMDGLLRNSSFRMIGLGLVLMAGVAFGLHYTVFQSGNLGSTFGLGVVAFAIGAIAFGCGMFTLLTANR